MALTDKADNGLYFRNAPPDSLQGPVIAELVLADGAQSAYILARDDAYGNGLAEVVTEVLDGVWRRGARHGHLRPGRPELRLRGQRHQGRRPGRDHR